MTTKRILILLATLAGTLCLIFVLPQQLGYQPVGIALDLPEYLGSWWGRQGEITTKEKLVLGPDTEFARREYQSGLGDTIHTSIVLAGQDMMVGIHRPERCLQAQGWTLGSGSAETVDVPGYQDLKVTRLPISRKDARPLPNGSPEDVRTIRSIAYYWFVGCSQLAATHEERVWIDIRDRLVHGYNQRWAMVMLDSEITRDSQRFGRDEKQTDQLMIGFVQQLAPKILRSNFQRPTPALVNASPEQRLVNSWQALAVR